MKLPKRISRQTLITVIILISNCFCVACFKIQISCLSSYSFYYGLLKILNVSISDTGDGHTSALLSQVDSRFHSVRQNTTFSVHFPYQLCVIKITSNHRQTQNIWLTERDKINRCLGEKLREKNKNIDLFSYSCYENSILC